MTTRKLDSTKAEKPSASEAATAYNAPLAALESIPSVLLRQYHALKGRYPEALLLFRVNECYEAFGEDATALHQLLGLPLSGRERKGPLSPHAGFKASELDTNLTALVKAGRKVAVCDELANQPIFREPEAASTKPAEHGQSEPNTQPAAIVAPADVFQRIDPRAIRVSPFQHRTIFDAAEMEELRKDIGRNGIHTALVVRKSSGAEGGYELVTGERRLRIAWELNLADAPVLVRELTDRQVKEMQWSENFRRANPDPLDEAKGLHQMLEYHKTVDGLARHIAKPKAYILTRLRLLDLAQDLQDMVHGGIFNLRDALELATLAQDAQQSFFTSRCADWKTRKNFRVTDLTSALDHFRRDLSRAVFNPKDKDVVPDTGACTQCPHNSATYASLFPDIEKKAVCGRQACFDNKTTAQLRRMLKDAVTEHRPTALVYYNQIGKTWQGLLDELPEISALPRFSYYEVHTAAAPTEPDRSDYDDDEEGFDEEGYEIEMADYRTEKEKFDADLQSGKLHKGLLIQPTLLECILFDPSRGRSSRNHEPSATAAAVQQAIKAGTVTAELLQGEITRIRDREIRSAELDREKIQLAVHQLFGKTLLAADPLPALTAADQLAIRLLVYQALNYSAKTIVEDRIPRIDNDQDTKKVPLIEWLAELTEPEFAFLVRQAMACHSGATDPNDEVGVLLIPMAEAIAIDVAGVRAAQTAVAETRNTRSTERIAELERQIAGLQAKNPKVDDTPVPTQPMD